jgi:putative FmdB family regulatory protein
MPTYEYTCKSCGEHLEVVQSFRDDPLTTCPACGGPLRKVFGNIGIVFKGSGFYKTDSRSNGSKDAATATVGAGNAGTDRGSEATSADNKGGDASSTADASSASGSGGKKDGAGGGGSGGGGSGGSGGSAPATAPAAAPKAAATGTAAP